MTNSLKAKSIRLFSILFTLTMFMACDVEQSKTKETKKLTNRVIILGLDGLSTHGYNTAKHPNLDSLMTNGVLSLQTRTVMPSVTLPNWTSHLTGSGPEQHGVGGNSWTLETQVLPPIATDDQG